MDTERANMEPAESENLKNAINYLNNHNIGSKEELDNLVLSDEDIDDKNLVFDVDEDITADIELPEELDEVEGIVFDDEDDDLDDDTDIDSVESKEDEEKNIESSNNVF